MNMRVLACSAIVSMSMANVFAQVEEDVTHYIINAGFDEDISFDADGAATKAITSTGRIADNRGLVFEAEDGSLYTKANDGKGENIAKELSWYGFITRIKGWEVTNTTESPAWIYSGSVPYDVKSGMLAVGDGKPAGYVAPPAKPEGFNTEDNTGLLILRSGWNGASSYKQVVKLPCAQYRLEYLTINANPNSTATATNLSKVTCRKDVFTDDTGLSSTEWTKHEIVFTPTSEFTIEFGYQAANSNSNSNPWLFVDGIKLYKIGEANEEELVKSDLIDAQEDAMLLFDDEVIGQYTYLIEEIQEFIMAADDAETVEDMLKATADIKAYIAKINDLKTTILNVEALINKSVNLMETTSYPGMAEFQATVEAAQNDMAEAGSDAFIQIEERLTKAITDYYMSQVASEENPADYTFLVPNPQFCVTNAEPTYDENGVATYPNADNYTPGSAPSDATSEGWYTANSIDAGQQRLNWRQGRICWNAWANNFTSEINIFKDLTDLPAGYYTVSADMITQPGYITDQHVLAKSTVESAVSPVLTHDTYNDEDTGEWETLTTGKVLVSDGKLTIGAASTGGGNAAAGWFLVTNFKLHYLGGFSEEALKPLYDAKVEACQAQCDTMKLAADKAAYQKVIAESKGATTIETINAALEALNAAQTEAEKSINEYNGIMTGTYTALQDSIQNAYSANAGKIVNAAVTIMTNYLNSAEATYTETGDYTSVLRAYRDTYVPAFEALEAMEVKDATAKEVKDNLISKQSAELTSISVLPTSTKLAEYAADLNKVLTVCNAANVYANGGNDYTALIVNPTIESETGWTFSKGEGNTNIGNGQNYDGSSSRYIDSYNSTAGKLLYTAYQTIENIPNGTYKLGAMNRTSGTPGEEGTYLYAIADNDTTTAKFKAIHQEKMNYKELGLTVTDAEGNVIEEEYVQDKYGSIWTEAYKWVLAHPEVESDPMIEIYEVNGTQGRGWFYNDLTIEVKNHTLTIGMTTDSTFTKGHVDTDGKPCVPFTGYWFSADNFTLTLLQAGDNAGWSPATGIEEVATENETVNVKVENGAIITDGVIYSINGTRVASGVKIPAGVYIVRQGKAATKVLVK